MILFLTFAVPVMLILERKAEHDPREAQRRSLRIVRAVFRFILKIAGVTYEVYGLENIPSDRAVLYVGNHRSYFDIVVGYQLIKGQAGFVAKKELKRIWLLSHWMKNLHCLFLDRENIKEGLKTILTGIDHVKHGISIWICPEGTRNKGKGMLEFKEGSMKIAEKSGCPIIPVAITGTAEIFESHIPWVKKSRVTVTFGEPIIISSLEKEQKKFLGAYTRQRILEMLPEEYREAESNN